MNLLKTFLLTVLLAASTASADQLWTYNLQGHGSDYGQENMSGNGGYVRQPQESVARQNALNNLAQYVQAAKDQCERTNGSFAVAAPGEFNCHFYRIYPKVWDCSITQEVNCTY